MRSHRLSLPLAVTCVCMLVGSVASVCHAYVRRTAKDTNQPLGWRGRTMEITGYSQGLDEMTLDQINTAMTAAAAPWTKADPTLATCTDLDLHVQVVDPSQTPPAAAIDKHNIIAVRHDTWDNDSQALALTSVFYYTKTGEIVEADVEVNATMGFTWVDVTTDPRADRQDLQNALTHELGHFIGLDHTCYLQGTPPSETDELGNPVPQCDTLPRNAPIRDSTMYPSSMAGDIDKRTLSPDDQKAVCDIYPLGQNTVGIGISADSGGCNCSVESAADRVAGAPSTSGSQKSMLWRSLIALGFVVLAVASRRPARGYRAKRMNRQDTRDAKKPDSSTRLP